MRDKKIHCHPRDDAKVDQKRLDIPHHHRLLIPEKKFPWKLQKRNIEKVKRTETQIPNTHSTPNKKTGKKMKENKST